MQLDDLQIALTPENAIYIYERYKDDPEGFMRDILGMVLDDWQREVCDAIKNGIRRICVSSGHGIGKTALSAGLNQWFIAVHPDPFIIATANTKQQLSEKTWRELAKWHQRSLIKNWFTWTATQFKHVESPETWFASAVPNTEHNSEAFAGAHEKYVLQIFDEASKIPDTIFEVSEGATATDGGYRIWIIFGNPTQNTGAFYEACFGNMMHRWHQIIVDARNCKFSDKQQIQDWLEDHGEDSDFFRVRVRGLPPAQSITNLIGAKLVADAQTRILRPEQYNFAPKVLSVDSARYGDDSTVWTYRQGLKLHWQREAHGLSETQIADMTIKIINEINPDTTFFDVTGGYGAGAYDMLKDLGYRVVSVNFAEKEGIDDECYNLRFQMWDDVRKWLELADIPNDKILARDLTTPDYFYNKQNGKKQLESKEDLKKRLGRSPDKGDSLAIGFAHPVVKQRHSAADDFDPINWRAI